MAVSAELKKLYLTAPIKRYWMEALVMEHSAIAPIFVTNAMTDFTAKVNGAAQTFISLPFTVKLPDRDASGSQVLEIAVTNLEQQLINDIETASKKPYEAFKCTYMVFISDQVDGDGDHISQLNPPPRYDIQAFTITATTITGAATKQNMHNRRWPYLLYKSSEFPGLV